MNPLEIHQHVAQSSGREVGDVSPLAAELMELANQAESAEQAQVPDTVREMVEREKAVTTVQHHLVDFVTFLQRCDVPQYKLEPLLSAQVLYDEESHEAYIAQANGEAIPYLGIYSEGLTNELPLPKEICVLSLSCMYNGFISLPELPPSLRELDCSSNKLTSLPELPAGLTRLSCSSNRLTALPKLPAGLTDLRCDANQLTALPELPSSLKVLHCTGNQLTDQQKQAILEQVPGARV